MKDRPTESAGVRAIATQVAEIRSRWAWVEPTIWTDRMLTALETGVKGGVWYSLMDKVESIPNLRSAFRRVRKNGGAAGVDRITIEMFEERTRMLEARTRVGARLGRRSRPAPATG